jgi:hypothetical protein
MYDVTEFQTVDKFVFPHEIVMTTEMPVSSQPISPFSSSLADNSMPTAIYRSLHKTKSDIVVSRLQLDKRFKDSDFEVGRLVKIPNGTPVSMQDVPQIKYVWFNGKVVPQTDEIALAIARGDYGFMPGPQNPRFWFMALGLGLLLLGGGLKIRTMLKGAG